MTHAKPLLALIVVLALGAAACGDSGDPDVAAESAEAESVEPAAESAEPAEPDSAETEWGAEYEQVVTDAFDNARRAQQRDNCRQARLMTRDELIELFVSSAGAGTSNFEQMMARLELTPDAQDFTYAAGLAVGVIRARCAEEFPNLAVEDDPADALDADPDAEAEAED